MAFSVRVPPLVGARLKSTISAASAVEAHAQTRRGNSVADKVMNESSLWIPDFRADLAFQKLTQDMVDRMRAYGREESAPANTVLLPSKQLRSRTELGLGSNAIGECTGSIAVKA